MLCFAKIADRAREPKNSSKMIQNRAQDGAPRPPDGQKRCSEKAVHFTLMFDTIVLDLGSPNGPLGTHVGFILGLCRTLPEPSWLHFEHPGLRFER